MGIHRIVLNEVFNEPDTYLCSSCGICKYNSLEFTEFILNTLN